MAPPHPRSEPRYAQATTLVTGEADDHILGFPASAAPSWEEEGEGGPTACKLHVINLLARAHGTGLADELMSRLLKDRGCADLIPWGGCCVSWRPARSAPAIRTVHRKAHNMSRPATRRHGVLTALLCAVSLAACTGGDETPEPTPPAVAPSVATTTATSVVTKLAQASTDVTKGGAAARAAVYVGPALESANAWAKVAPAHPAKEKAAKELTTDGVEVLAVSRGQQYPHQILAKTTLKQSKAAVLVLLVSEQAGDDFKAAAVTPLLPGATIEALDPVDKGSAPLGDGSGLAATPDEVVTAFAESVRYPEPEPSDLLEPDAWSEQLRKAAKEQVKSLGSAGVYTQTHTPGGVLGGFRLGDGKGAIVFANLVRDETIAWRNPTKLKPGKDFTALTGVKTITSEAKLTSNETLAIVIPETGKAQVVAARDQLVDGSGS